MFQRKVTDCASCPIGAASGGERELCVCTPRRVPAGALVASAADALDRALFVRDGALAVCAVDSHGTEAEVSLRGPRSLLFTRALRGAPGAAFEVRAVTDTWVCSASSVTLERWVGPDGSPARALFSLLMEELGARQEDVRWRHGDSVTRVARFLAHSGAVGGLQKQLVARVLGMRPETLSRSLAKLEELGLVDASHGLRVLDVEGLKAIAAGESVGKPPAAAEPAPATPAA